MPTILIADSGWLGGCICGGIGFAQITRLCFVVPSNAAE